MGKKLNNRYVLLDKSEWSDVSITMKPQINHLCNDRSIHSKDTQLRYTHNKENDDLKNKKRIDDLKTGLRDKIAWGDPGDERLREIKKERENWRNRHI